MRKNRNSIKSKVNLVENKSALKVAVKYCDHYRGLAKPLYQTAGAAGVDLLAAIDGEIIIKPGDTVLVPSGLCLSIPAGFEGQVRPRSGLALKHGVTVLNSPGTIDSDYRGEVKVILINHGREDFMISRGMRMAQMVIGAVVRMELTEQAEIDATGRNDGGFGHTGV